MHRPVFVIDMPPTGFETITVGNAAVSVLTAAKVANAKAAFITVEDADIRYRIDGANADANTGHLVPLGQNMFFSGPNANGATLRQLNMIAANSTDANVMVTYY